MDKDSRLYNWLSLGLRIAVCVAVGLLVLGSVLCGIRGIEPDSFVISLQGILDGGPAPLTIIHGGGLRSSIHPPSRHYSGWSCLRSREGEALFGDLHSYSGPCYWIGLR